MSDDDVAAGTIIIGTLDSLTADCTCCCLATSDGLSTVQRNVTMETKSMTTYF